MEISDEFTFEHNELPFHCFSKFRDMKGKKEFCDITLKFGSRSVSAHRIVLAAVIPYFSDLLCDQTTASESEISVKGIDPLSLESIIEFAYNCKVKITAANVANLLSAAFFLKVDQVREACCSFLAVRLTAENVLSTLELAKNFNCVRLLKSANDYICRNFDEVTKTEVFSSVSFKFLEQLIQRNDLQCSAEENVFEYVMRWVSKSPAKRKCKLPLLLRRVRMTLITPEFLTRVSKEKPIRSSVKCRDIVEDARTCHFLPHYQEKVSSFDTLPRTPFLLTDDENVSSSAPDQQDPGEKNAKYYKSLTPGIYVASRSTVLTLQCFNTETKEWSMQKTTTFQSDFHNGVLGADSGNLYYVDRGDVRSYDSSNDNWLFCWEPFWSGKYSCGAAVLNNKLYLCGGQKGGDYTKTVECCDLKTCESSSITAMSVARGFPGVVVLEEHLYVLGGESYNGLYLDSLEKYDSCSGLWASMAPMRTRRCGMGCTSMDGKIYVCGGSSSIDSEEDNFVLSSAEVYSPLKNKWHHIAPLNIGRFLCSLVERGGKLFALGGYDKNSDLVNTMEIYDPITNSWKLGQPFDISMGFVQAVAL